MRRASLLLLLSFVPTIARSQSITSFSPDSTAKAAHSATPADMVDVPVWLGIQFAPIPGVTSKLNTQERTDAQNCTPWIGVGAAWPWAKPRETWLEAGYQHWEFAGTYETKDLVGGGSVRVAVIDPITLDQFTARFGIDQWFWQPNRVSASIGAGLGVGTGWTQAPSVVESNVLLTSEFVGPARPARPRCDRIGRVRVRRKHRERLVAAPRVRAEAGTVHAAPEAYRSGAVTGSRIRPHRGRGTSRRDRG
jgi:hypothetical protein